MLYIFGRLGIIVTIRLIKENYINECGVVEV